MQGTFRKFFDESANHYATEREHMPYYLAQLRIVQSILANESRGTMLDIGCAAGVEISVLRSFGFKVIGVDLSETMLQFARARFEGNSELGLICADAEHLPLSSNSVDHVLCLGLFEFLSDYSPSIAEICRVLRPRGLAIIGMPSGVSVYNVSYRFADATLGPIWRTLKRVLKPRAAIPLGPQEKRNRCIPWKFRSLLEKHGLKVQRSAFANYFIYPLERFPALDVKVATLLEPLASVPILRIGATYYLVSARKS
jgi:ubiquinone/menaquinone biosynthesis C-methylase UbiE